MAYRYHVPAPVGVKLSVWTRIDPLERAAAARRVHLKRKLRRFIAEQKRAEVAL